MQVDFWQLSEDPVERVIPLIARRTRQAGEKLLVVSSMGEQLEKIDRSLWEMIPDAFLAHGYAHASHAARQPLLLSQECTAPNAAQFIAFADGQWREEALQFDRAFLLFGDEQLEHARDCWRMLGKRKELQRRFWKQENGKWREGP
ncbi:DNA polymerase III subunit chi [Altericroceibacterium spongiae]|uniref:DNA polymerase III subunit chi n=1 Tax=Altericroceibacterium spongiae TaxID=2320269 RepID=A0A420ER66_9SPHN|nr:DNA polymerase III subunit chi [Altericroceibacterium spongiae]RKF23175.1 DNA polymerase III subunit chi [Altericroceibacterium spongiae]